LPRKVGEGANIKLLNSGRTLLQGDPAFDNGNGAVWIFTRSSVDSPFDYSAGLRIVPDGIMPKAEFGYALALSADERVLVVGAPGDENNRGAVFTFMMHRSIFTEWYQVGPKVSPSQGADIRIGTLIDISRDGSRIVVGTLGVDVIAVVYYATVTRLVARASVVPLYEEDQYRDRRHQIKRLLLDNDGGILYVFGGYTAMFDDRSLVTYCQYIISSSISDTGDVFALNTTPWPYYYRTLTANKGNPSLGSAQGQVSLLSSLKPLHNPVIPVKGSTLSSGVGVGSYMKEMAFLGYSDANGGRGGFAFYFDPLQKTYSMNFSPEGTAQGINIAATGVDDGAYIVVVEGLSAAKDSDPQSTTFWTWRCETDSEKIPN